MDADLERLNDRAKQIAHDESITNVGTSPKSQLNGIFQQLVEAAKIPVDESLLTRQVYRFITLLREEQRALFEKMSADFVVQFEQQARSILKQFLDKDLGGAGVLDFEGVEDRELLDELVDRYEESPRKLKALAKFFEARASEAELNKDDHEFVED